MEPLLVRLRTLIADVGESPNFVAAMAHFWFAWSVVITLHLSLPRVPAWSVAIAIVAVAAVKEFWFDARYERNPPQTFIDNLQDFAGYSAGALLAFLFVKFYPL